MSGTEIPFNNDTNLLLSIAIMSLYNELKSSIISGNINDNRKKMNYSAEKNFIHEETDDTHAFLTTLIDVLKDQTKFPFIDNFFSCYS